MRKLNYIITVLLLSCICSCGQSKENTDLDSIRAVYKKYRIAIEEGKPKDVVSYVSKRCIAFHDTLFHHILYSRKEELKPLDIAQRIWVLEQRHSMPPGYWDTMDPGKWFVIQGRQNPVDPELKGRITDECNVGDASALCVLNVSGRSTGLPVYFDKENGDWKLYVVTIRPGGVDALNEQREKMKLSEEQYFIHLLKLRHNKVLSEEELYKPIK